MSTGLLATANGGSSARNLSHVSADRSGSESPSSSLTSMRERLGRSGVGQERGAGDARRWALDEDVRGVDELVERIDEEDALSAEDRAQVRPDPPRWLPCARARRPGRARRGRVCRTQSAISRSPSLARESRNSAGRRICSISRATRAEPSHEGSRRGSPRCREPPHFRSTSCSSR